MSMPTPSNFSPYQPPRDEYTSYQTQPPQQQQQQQRSGAPQPKSAVPASPRIPQSTTPTLSTQQQQTPQAHAAQHSAYPPTGPRGGAYLASTSPYPDSYQAGAGVGGSSSYGGLSPSSPTYGRQGGSGGAGNWDADRVRVNKYETTLSVRLDILAALAYALGPITGALLLVFETSNDYVRFHAWQSCLFFTAALGANIILGLMSSFLGWLCFSLQLVTAGYTAYRAYEDGQALDRFHLPFVGEFAARWVDSE